MQSSMVRWRVGKKRERFRILGKRSNFIILIF